MKSDKTAIIYDPIYKEHKPRLGHPEAPERCDAALKGIAESVSEDRLLMLSPRKATKEEIMYCHTVEKDVVSERKCLSTGDTDVSERSFEAAIMAAGGVLAAVDAVMDGSARNAFCLPRPPGHHATIDAGMGFCIFNNVAIGAKYLQKKYKVKRVLIIDWDVHHGNGTQDIFYDDPSVFYFSTHQWPCFPGTGRASDTGTGAGKGFTLNCPFPLGSGGHEVIGAFKEQLLPAMKKFKPEFIFISAGFDARVYDLVGNFLLNDKDFADLTDIVMKMAAEYSSQRVVSVLEGGYTLSGLASATGSHAAQMADPAP